VDSSNTLDGFFRLIEKPYLTTNWDFLLSNPKQRTKKTRDARRRGLKGYLKVCGALKRISYRGNNANSLIGFEPILVDRKSGSDDQSTPGNLERIFDATEEKWGHISQPVCLSERRLSNGEVSASGRKRTLATLVEGHRRIHIRGREPGNAVALSQDSFLR
jgi:hypothetical protein